MLEFQGEPLYAACVRCLPLQRAAVVVFVLLRSPVSAQIEADIAKRFAHLPWKVVLLDEPTRGQAETVLFAGPYIDCRFPILIHNVDTLFRSEFSFLDVESPWDGLIGVCSDVPGSHWSFVEVSTGDEVVRTTEKVRISRWVSTGLYGFRSWDVYKSALLDNRGSRKASQTEEFVAPLFNSIVGRGGQVIADPASWMLPLGTPEEYECPVCYIGRPLDGSN